MIQNIIKKVLRKWLKKKVYKGGYGIPLNEKRFAWVYKSPIRQWKIEFGFSNIQQSVPLKVF